MKQVVWLSEINLQHQDTVGSKAAHLGRLMADGFAVPSGFCLTNSAYNNHLLKSSQFDLTNLIEQRQFRAIRDYICQHKFDTALVSDVLNSYQQLMDEQPGAVAVRSSSTAEDLADYSFAGLYETVLNVTGEAALLDAIRVCWASYWSDEAIFYREQVGLPHADHAMGIAVQAMIQPRLAGVLFTQDPLNQAEPIMVAEVIQGNADALVSGDIRGERFLIDRASKQLINAVQSDTSVDLSFLPQLASAGLAIEQSQGDTQDIEWCIDEHDRLWFVQTRSITRPMASEKTQPAEELSGWHLAYDDPFSTVGCDLAIQRHSYWVRIINHTYKTRFKPEIKAVDNLLYYKPSWHTPPRMLRIWINFWKLINWLRANQIYKHYIKSVLPSHRRRLAEIEVQNIAALSDDDLLAGFNTAIELYLELQYASYPMIEIVKRSITVLDGLCKHWLSKNSNLRISDFLSGLDNLTVTRDLQLYRLGQDLRALYTSDQLAKLTYVDLVALQNKGQAEQVLWGKLQAFLDQYGYIWADRYPRDPAWEMNEAAFVAALAHAAQTPTETKLLSGHAYQKQHQVQAIEEAKQQLSATSILPVRWHIFRWVLGRAERVFPHKENRNHDVYNGVLMIRKYLREIGYRLSERQLLETANNIFFLTSDEIRNIWRHGKITTTLRQRIEDRKQQYHNKKQLVSKSTTATHIVDIKSMKNAESETIELAGEACSPGLVSGPTRIISGLNELQSVQPGDIVVCRHMRPAWSPVFAKAGGVVVQVGSLLSHGATLAREYGVPAVMNIPNLIEVVGEGDILIIDGHLGAVTVKKRPTL